MSEILGSITGALGQLFKNLLPSWGDPTPPKLPKPSDPPVPEEELESEEEGESDYKTADEGDKSNSESDNESKPEEKNKIIFQRIEDLAPKRLVETRRISDQG